MGWLWQSLQSQSEASNSTVPTTDGAPRPVPQNGAPAASADSDLEGLLASLEAKPSTNITPAPQETPAHYAPSPSGSTVKEDDDAPLDISPEALFPRTMSCRAAFDQAFYCQSLGGKFNDVYRYGELRSCSDNWNAFWFCMRIKGLPDHERQDLIKEYYQERETKIKAEKGSSEDIWDIRTEPVKKAFWRDPNEKP